MKQKTVIILLLFLLFLGKGAKSSEEGKIDRKELIGIWHIMPVLGSGWNDNYHFFQDGTFRYDYNEMDGEKRIINKSGNWSVKDNKLFLKITKKTVITGGEFIKASGSIATDYEIIKGIIEEVELSSPEEIIYPLDSIKKDPENPHLFMIKIGGVKFWKFSNDPERIN